MYFVLNFFIWVRKNIIRIIFKQYPNKLLASSNYFYKKKNSKTNLITSTDNLWVSKYMFEKWENYSIREGINLSIFSNKDVNDYMYRNFKNDLIYEIYKRSVIPVQKIDIFRICFIYEAGGIWLDLKSEVNLDKVIALYKKSNNEGLLLSEPRSIEIVENLNGLNKKKFGNVIHNGFFFLPKGSVFLSNVIKKIEQNFLYFQDVEFTYPKQGIMNLTGPHQFTRTYHGLNKKNQPLIVTHDQVNWEYCSKYGEYLSPFRGDKHYSSYKCLKTIDSGEETYLKEK